jgi:hypothetical protein
LFEGLFPTWTAGGRYDGDQWKKVYDILNRHADRALQKNLITDLDQNLRARLQIPRIRQDLEFGSIERQRFYSVVIGQDQADSKSKQDGTRYASKDAQSVHELLGKMKGQKQSVLLSGEVSKKKVLEALANLRTKSVDKVLFYFSGQGLHKNGRGQGLLLAKGEILWLSELRQAFAKVQAKNVAFVFDASFGGRAYRALNKGRRTAANTERAKAPEGYLSVLADEKRGWQVLCSASSNQATGEYRSHGLLSGLFIEKLKSGQRTNLKEMGQELKAALGSRSEVLFGRRHSPFWLPKNGRRNFLIVPEPIKKPAKSTSSTRNKGNS